MSIRISKSVTAVSFRYPKHVAFMHTLCDVGTCHHTCPPFIHTHTHTHIIHAYARSIWTMNDLYVMTHMTHMKAT